MYYNRLRRCKLDDEEEDHHIDTLFEFHGLEVDNMIGRTSDGDFVVITNGPEFEDVETVKLLTYREEGGRRIGETEFDYQIISTLPVDPEKDWRFQFCVGKKIRLPFAIVTNNIGEVIRSQIILATITSTDGFFNMQVTLDEDIPECTLSIDADQEERLYEMKLDSRDKSFSILERWEVKEAYDELFASGTINLDDEGSFYLRSDCYLTNIVYDRFYDRRESITFDPVFALGLIEDPINLVGSEMI